MKDKFKKYYMSIAELTAELSHCTRKKVGCIVVKNDRIISIGYNGTVSGDSNNDVDEYGNTLPEIFHAEANAISKLCRSVESSEGCLVFVTLSPCLECSKILYNAGIVGVYYQEDYRNLDGIEFLKKHGIMVEKI
jgi:dCMP deaminase